ncbi:MAG: class I SAM-dependent methyltransferase [bacterium]|nr:class I SAM-dependent methyltransferase [bacterium]
MSEKRPLTDKPELNQMKEVTTPSLYEDLREMFEYEDGAFFKQPRNIISLFAGNGTEIAYYASVFAEQNVSGSNLTAVDKEPPSIDRIAQFNEKAGAVLPPDFNKPVFVQADAFEYIEQAAPGNLDLITAFGAEFAFYDPVRNAEFVDAVHQALRVGGYVRIPTVGDRLFSSDIRFGRVLHDFYQKK